MSERDFMHLYNPKVGRFQWQHRSGGVFFNELKDINPSLMKGSITGSGHQPIKQTKDILEFNRDELKNTGEEIVKRLRGSLTGKKNINDRVNSLIKGNGLQVM